MGTSSYIWTIYSRNQNSEAEKKYFKKLQKREIWKGTIANIDL